jgi:hypothetical protein
MITRPSDRRLHRSRSAPRNVDATRVRVLVSNDDVVSVTGHLDGMPIPFSRSADETGIWQAVLPAAATGYRARLTVTARTADGRSGEDAITLQPAGHAEKHLRHHAALGTDAHAVEPWPEHGVLGSQLGPNKNGRHW